MRVIFLGTPEFGVNVLKAIHQSTHEVVGVVCQPDRPSGRGHKLVAPPVKVLAEELGLKVFQFDKISKQGVQELKNLNADGDFANFANLSDKAKKLNDLIYDITTAKYKGDIETAENLYKSYRTVDDMVYEWKQHNLAFQVLPEGNSFRESAKDVDLDPRDQGKSLVEIYEARTGQKLDLSKLFN